MTTSHDPNTQATIALHVCLGFTQQGKRLRRIDVGTVGRLAVDQHVKQVQHMRFGRHALIESQFHSPDDNLFVVMKEESEDIGHLTIAAQATQHMVLQLSKRRRQFQERRTIA